MTIRAVILLLISIVVLPSCHQADPPSAQSTLSIQGMHCNKCAASIHESVIVIDGVRSSDVSFEEGAATITASNPTIIEKAIERIRIMGFTVDENSAS